MSHKCLLGIKHRLPVCPFALVKFIFAREYGIPCKSLLNTQANSPILQNGTPGLKLLKNVQYKTQCPAITNLIKQ